MADDKPIRRSARAREAILEAALQLTSEQGYERMTMEGIAKRAGVGKQTIYRWWPSKAAVLQEAINEQVGSATDFPDTGDIMADLGTQMRGVASLFVDERVKPYFQGLIAAAQSDPKVSESFLANIIYPRVQPCIKRLERAVEQGQVRDDVDLSEVVELIYAPLYYRLLLQTRPVTVGQTERILEVAFSGLAPKPE